MPSRISKFALNGLEKVNQRLIITCFIGFFDFFTIVIPSGEPARRRDVSWAMSIFCWSKTAWSCTSAIGCVFDDTSSYSVCSCIVSADSDSLLFATTYILLDDFASSTAL